MGVFATARSIGQILQLRAIALASPLLAAVTGGYQFFVDSADGHFKVKNPAGVVYDFQSGGTTGAASYVKFNCIIGTVDYVYPELIGKTIGMARKDQLILNDTDGETQDYAFDTATGTITLNDAPTIVSKCTFFYK